jgi:hypothetical protein
MAVAQAIEHGEHRIFGELPAFRVREYRFALGIRELLWRIDDADGSWIASGGERRR